MIQENRYSCQYLKMYIQKNIYFLKVILRYHVCQLVKHAILVMLNYCEFATFHPDAGYNSSVNLQI